MPITHYIYSYDLLGKFYLAYRTGQSADLTVIGNPVFTLSRDLVFPLSRDQRNQGHIAVHTFYSIAFNIPGMLQSCSCKGGWARFLNSRSICD